MERFSQSRRKNGRTYRASWCYDCVSAGNKKNREHIRQTERKRDAWKYKHRPSWKLVESARGRAKVMGIKFNLTEADVVIPEYCPILGIKLKRGRGGGPTPNSPSLDRIDPTKGYVKGNVWVISHRANRIKNNATAEELMLVATKVYERTYCDGRTVKV